VGPRRGSARVTPLFPDRVLITGASGFIGSRLCEVLSLLKVCTVRAFVHSTGSAARIARLPLDFAVGDLCDAASVEKAMDGCNGVVHLARGSTRVMRTGLENLLRAAVRHKVSRFVHMSSVAVYGNDPPPESANEDTPTRRTNLPYGNEKLGQERRVHRYVRRHSLPAVILRPPNVYGPFSPFTVGLLDQIRGGRLAIVDEGSNPCNLAYVDNVIEAVLLALWMPEAVGQTFFVTDRAFVTWKQCLEHHAAILGTSIQHVSSSDLVTPAPEHRVRDSVRVLPGVLFSPDFRRAVRQVPVIRDLEQFAYERFELLSPSTQQKIRLRLHGPERPNRASMPRFQANNNIIAAQARKVAHSSDKAMRMLGYTAPISYSEGMALTREWLHSSRLI
jgi:nucleoside-diphosphate-sugar epimerase